jgi:lauroyl/myristoyl acyltransferase
MQANQATSKRGGQRRHRLRVWKESSTMASSTGNPARQPRIMTRVNQAFVETAGTPGKDPQTASSSERLGWYTRAKFGLVRWILMIWTRSFSLKGLYILGRYFGTIEYLINFRRRARYRRELRRIFAERLEPTGEKQIILEYFRRTRCDKLLYVIFDRLPREKILRRIRFHGRQYLDEALQRGNGIYVMLSHHGSHHVAGLLMALLGYKCAGVRDRNEGASRIYVQQKYAETFPEFAAIRVLYADTFPRDIYRCFHENHVVGSALDVSRVRGMALKTCPVKIFGEQREFLTGTLQIALRCRATVAQAFVVSRPNFYFRLIVRPPLYLPGEKPDADPQDRVAELMQRYADGIETHVREHPDHLSRV